MDGATLWANLHLLFWLSRISFLTSWVGESGFGTWSVAAYGVVLLLCAMAWEIERRVLLMSALAKALGRNVKEWVSLVLYAVAIGTAFVCTWVHAFQRGVVSDYLTDSCADRQM